MNSKQLIRFTAASLLLISSTSMGDEINITTGTIAGNAQVIGKQEIENQTVNNNVKPAAVKAAADDAPASDGQPGSAETVDASKPADNAQNAHPPRAPRPPSNDTINVKIGNATDSAQVIGKQEIENQTINNGTSQ